ncbi:tyrosine-type recombinase/integrase [Lysinibacillus irui]|uniref:Tyrosine-type recombinase/integrase n=1 Tax=Lysinibacillus irui TaxID=2998077 RepID=A0AAJ5UXP8_9BACI|nr:tyrosine-type recombinase/integrase [Lysinibacillus irui]WDV08320.1 tyrosine-type recombinase/integrase [Lysinibacillus irui]
MYFNTRCSIWLKRYLDEREDKEPRLFITDRRPKRRMSIDNLRYIIKRISNRASIKEYTSASITTQHATHMINNGAPIDVIQSLLGHEKSETTKIRSAKRKAKTGFIQ